MSTQHTPAQRRLTLQQGCQGDCGNDGPHSPFAKGDISFSSQGGLLVFGKGDWEVVATVKARPSRDFIVHADILGHPCGAQDLLVRNDGQFLLCEFFDIFLQLLVRHVRYPVLAKDSRAFCRKYVPKGFSMTAPSLVFLVWIWAASRSWNLRCTSGIMSSTVAWREET